MAVAGEDGPPSVPSDFIAPSRHRNASKLPDASVEEPAIQPLALMPLAKDRVPPSVPSACVPPASVQRNARSTPAGNSAWPITWLASFKPVTEELMPPRVPRSRTGARGTQRAAWTLPEGVVDMPATTPDALMDNAVSRAV